MGSPVHVQRIGLDHREWGRDCHYRLGIRYNAGELAARRRRSSSGAHRRWLRRRKIRRILTAALLLIGVAALVDHLGVFGDHGDDQGWYDRKSGVVLRVIDGDSAVVSVDSHEVLIQLLGVDAPEMNFGDQQTEQYWSTQARDYLLERIGKKTILLKLDPPRMRDRFGRLLVYAYLSDTDNVNLAMIRDGYAYADRREKHTLESQFESAEADARQRRRGLWPNVTVQQMPQWRKDWLEERKKGNTEP